MNRGSKQDLFYITANNIQSAMEHFCKQTGKYVFCYRMCYRVLEVRKFFAWRGTGTFCLLYLYISLSIFPALVSVSLSFIFSVNSKNAFCSSSLHEGVRVQALYVISLFSLALYLSLGLSFILSLCVSLSYSVSLSLSF